MISNTLKEQAIQAYENMNTEKHPYLGAGAGRSVYSINDFYVVKVEPIDDFLNSWYYDTNGKLSDLYNYLEKYLNNKTKKIAGFEINKKVTSKSIRQFKKFCKMVELEEDKKSLNLYLNFLTRDSEQQNITDYINYLTVKDNRKLNPFLQKMMGIIVLEDVTLLVQEKGETSEDYRSDTQKMTQVLTSQRLMEEAFTEQNYDLWDCCPSNIVIDRDGKPKMCDLGICRFSKFPLRK